MTKKLLLISGTLFVLIAIPLTVAVLNGNLDFRKQARSTVASFSFDPSSGTIQNGNDFEINVLINTGGKSISGADLSIGFDKNLTQVVDADTSKNGIQVNSGSFFDKPLVLANKVEGDKIYLSINSFSPFKGSGVFGTIKFHALKPGQFKLSIKNGNENKITEQGTGVNLVTGSTQATFNIEGDSKSKPSQATDEGQPSTEAIFSIDLNHDGVANDLDLQLLSKKIGATKDITDFDLNKDGKVDQKDIAIFITKYKELKSKSLTP